MLVIFSFNKGLLLVVCLIFYLIFGEWVWGWLGYVIDIFVVFVILFGLVILLGIVS